MGEYCTGIDYAGVVKTADDLCLSRIVDNGQGHLQKWDTQRWRDFALFCQCLKRHRDGVVDFSAFETKRPKMDRKQKRKIQYLLDRLGKPKP